MFTSKDSTPPPVGSPPTNEVPFQNQAWPASPSSSSPATKSNTPSLLKSPNAKPLATRETVKLEPRVKVPSPSPTCRRQVVGDEPLLVHSARSSTPSPLTSTGFEVAASWEESSPADQ